MSEKAFHEARSDLAFSQNLIDKMREEAMQRDMMAQMEEAEMQSPEEDPMEEMIEENEQPREERQEEEDSEDKPEEEKDEDKKGIKEVFSDGMAEIREFFKGFMSSAKEKEALQKKRDAETKKRLDSIEDSIQSIVED